MQAPPVKDGPRTNEDIRAPRVLLIDEAGEKQGIMPTSAAIEAAQEAGLDLVEVSPNSDPPVCKILDYGKFRFQEQKKKNEARKRQKIVEIKEIKLRPNIDTHDYDVKAKAMHRFYHDFVWDGRPLLLQSRAMDSTGYVQPTKDALRAIRGVDSIYHNNGIQTWAISETGEAENVEVS